MVAVLRALIEALLSQLKGLIREDKKGKNADETPKELRRDFDDMVRRKLDDDGMRDD
tara:strand:- start:226 stop:396 length:171 start_codon:yes stop_codon:yes gene_type:complete